MLAHCKEVLENGMIAIHPKHNKLITALRTAEMINNEQAKAESAGAKLEQPIECSEYFIRDILACSMIYSSLNPDLSQAKVLFVFLVNKNGIKHTLYLGATQDLFKFQASA